MSDTEVTDEQWRAIADNDGDYDGVFLYAVRTTGIFCRPSCKSKLPKRENVEWFQLADQAITAGYRPCKRCRPTGMRLPDEAWVDMAAEYVAKHFAEALTLEELAAAVHGSPFHLHRTFKRIKGVTPLAFIQAYRLERAKTLLESTDETVSEIGRKVGLGNAPYFITFFKKKTGLTPESYRIEIRQRKGRQ